MASFSKDALPASAPGFTPASLTGAWYLLFTSDPFWRQRTHPRLEYGEPSPGPDGRERLRHELRFRRQGMMGLQRKLLVCVEEHQGQGALRRRAQGVLRAQGRRWSVPKLGADARWLLVFHLRGGLGGRPGLDVHSRDPWIAQERLDEILAAIDAVPEAAALRAELYATIQDWVPREPYRL